MDISQKVLQQLSITDKIASTAILHFLYMLTQQKAGIDFLKCKTEKKTRKKSSGLEPSFYNRLIYWNLSKL